MNESNVCSIKCANDELLGRNARPIIWQIFQPELTRYPFPYPPVYIQEDVDYICFTDKKDVQSKFWQVEYWEEICEEKIREKMSSFPMARELHTNEIQIGNLFLADHASEAVVEVPSFGELPLISFDPKQFVPTIDAQGNYIYKKNPIYHGGKYDGREYLLTLGMPVSNQIETIERCLSHVKPLLDKLDAELLIVDTGSTDGTLDVCRSYGARIIEFPWCDNMSAARNQGIYHAKGEWYMSLDDDEWFEDVDDILDFFQSGNYKNFDIASYTQRNYIYSDQQIYKDTIAVRMAKITPEIHFEGRIHDSLVSPDVCRLCQLSSYVHHYGFVVDHTERKQEKYIRNVTGLLYDLWETPQNLRYNYQLAQEFLAVGYYPFSYAYGFCGLAVDRELDTIKYGRMHASLLISALYYAEDQRIFDVIQMLSDRYRFTEAERAYFSYVRADLGERFSYDASEVLEYLKEYQNYLQLYAKNELENRCRTYQGFDVCINEQYWTDARVMAFWAYCELGEREHALEVLETIQPEYILYKKPLFIRLMLRVDAETYDKMLCKMNAPQFELWIADVMQAFQEDLDQCPWLWERFVQMIGYLSVQKLQQYIAWNGLKICPQLQSQLEKNEGSLLEEDLSVSDLYLLSELAKQQMLAAPDNSSRMNFFKNYVSFAGRFAHSYFHPALLRDVNSTAISPDVKAAYEIYLALTDSDVNGTIAHLRQAIACFPGFKREIQALLNEIQGKQNKQKTMNQEMAALKQQLEQQIVVLRQQGMMDEVDAIEAEMKKIFGF